MIPRLRTALVGLPVILALGCSSNLKFDQGAITSGDSAPTVSSNSVVFDPSGGKLPLPNILLTASVTTPITLTAGVPLDPQKAMVYVNQREMGGTHAVSGLNAPIYIAFAGTVKASTITASNIKVFKVLPDVSGAETGTLGFQNVSAMFSYKVLPSGAEVELFPNFPLEPGTRYLYVVTDGVLDNASNLPVNVSTTFGLLKYVKSGGVSAATDTTRLSDMTDPTNPAVVVGPTSAASLEGIAGNVFANPPTNTVVALSGYRKTMWDLVASTTADVSGKTGATATGIGTGAESQLQRRDHIKVIGRFITSGAGFMRPNLASSTQAPVEAMIRSFAAGANLGGLPGKTWDNTVTIDAALPPNTYWSGVFGTATAAPATVGGVFLGHFTSADLGVDPAIVAANAASMNLTGTTGAWNPATGITQPFRVSGALTGFYHTNRTINFVYIKPAAAAPVGGYPMVIYTHGVTSQKETVVALAQSLTTAGFAVLAMDLPLHNSNAVPGHTTGTAWGQDFMAIGAPLAARTNMQSSILHLNRLEMLWASNALSAALEANTVGASPSITLKPKYVGVSLGSMVGAYYLASNSTLPAPAATDMKGLLSVPGARTAYLLADSPSFGPSIIAGLNAAGIATNSPTYHQFLLLTQSVFDPVDPATLTSPLAAGLAGRLSGRVLVQEATTTTFDATTGAASNGDLTIPNWATRYFANALGGRGVLGATGAAIAPNFKQLGYGTTPTFPTITNLPAGYPGAVFMYSSLSPVTPKTGVAALAVTDTTPNEGYFQFYQAGVAHTFLLGSSGATLAGLGQKQMLYFFGITGTGIAVDPTSGTLPVAAPISPEGGLTFDMGFTEPVKVLAVPAKH